MVPVNMNDDRAKLKEIVRLTGDLLERLTEAGVERISLDASAVPAAEPPPECPPPGPSGASTAPVSPPEPAEHPPAADAGVSAALRKIDRAIAKCQKCCLGKTRNRVVFGTGSPHPPVVFIGEAPGAEEDRQGLPFVGRAGQLLTKMLECIGFRREDVYITNILKCRPPGNRDPQPDEVACCEPYLLDQLALLKPRLICALGRHAAQTLLKTDTGINKLRGTFHDYHGIKILPTFHPAYLLRNPADKHKAWDDLKKVRAFVDESAE